ncbi:hypothetical protein D3C81_1327180 [compost metagenome]
MAAGIEERIEHTVLVARDEDRLTPHGRGQEIVVVGELAFVGEVNPVAFEDVRHLQFEQPRIGEHLPLAAVGALLLVFFKHGIEVVESQGHGRGLHCYCSGQVRLGRRSTGQ